MNRKDKIMNQKELWGNTREIMQHVLKMEQTSLLIKHIKGISRGVITLQLSATSSRL
jgi:hypothetical protein